MSPQAQHRWYVFKRNFVDAVCWLLVATVILYFLFPAVWMLLMSFKNRVDATAFPPVLIFKPTFEHYRAIIAGSFQAAAVQSGASGMPGALPNLRNSIVVALSTTALTLTLGTPAAYAFAASRFRGLDLLSFAVLAIRFLPPISYVVPIYLLGVRMGLVDTLPLLIIVYTVMNLPFIIWLLRGFFQDLPGELEESARVDGCTRWGAFRRILLPLVAPGLAATTIFAFMLAWNDFTIAFMLTESGARTMPVALSRFISNEMGVFWGELSAGSMVTILPMMIFVLLAQRSLVRGLSAGAVKG